MTSFTSKFFWRHWGIFASTFCFNWLENSYLMNRKQSKRWRRKIIDCVRFWLWLSALFRNSNSKQHSLFLFISLAVIAEEKNHVKVKSRVERENWSLTIRYTIIVSIRCSTNAGRRTIKIFCSGRESISRAATMKRFKVALKFERKMKSRLRRQERVSASKC